MVYDLQKANLWKRIAAWIFDGIVVVSLAVGFAFLLSAALDYDGHGQTVNDAYAKYERTYGVVFDITQEEYEAMDKAQRENYDAAYEALTADEVAMNAYQMMVNLMLVITSAAILLAVLLWELVIPLFLKNGQTLGKKIFGLCLVRIDGVKMNNMQLFTRTLLGKCVVETMIPVFIVMMIYWGIVGLSGTLCLLVLLVAQAMCMIFSHTNSAIHDLMAGTVVVDMASQMIFRTTEDLIEYKKRIAAERASRQSY